MRWAIYIEIPLLAVGLFLFLGSLHSGGPLFYASAIFVPPLLLDIFGLLPASNFPIWLAMVASLQYMLCLLVAFVVVSLRGD